MKKDPASTGLRDFKDKPKRTYKRHRIACPRCKRTIRSDHLSEHMRSERCMNFGWSGSENLKIFKMPSVHLRKYDTCPICKCVMQNCHIPLHLPKCRGKNQESVTMSSPLFGTERRLKVGRPLGQKDTNPRKKRVFEWSSKLDSL